LDDAKSYHKTRKHLSEEYLGSAARPDENNRNAQ